MKRIPFIALLISSGFAFAAEVEIPVPSDPSATYYLLERGGEGDARTITTKRVGKSGETFSARLYQCDQGSVKYLGTGETLAAMKASIPDPSMSKIVPGSIAHFVGIEACK